MKRNVFNFSPVIITAIICLIFVNKVRADYQSEVLADNPLVYLRFQDANVSNDAVIADLGSAGLTSTYSVSGTSTFDVVPGAGKTGNALYWDQTGDGNVHAAIADPTEALSYSDITVEAWVRVQPEDYSNYMELFTSSGDLLHMGSPSIWLTFPNEWAMVGGDEYALGYDVPGADGEWHHVVGLWDSGASTAMTLYVDGVYIDTHNSPNDLHYDQYDHWMIGCEGNIYLQMYLFHGDLDEFAIYEGLLSEDRIVAHYLAGIPEPATLALLGLGGLAIIRKRRM